MSILIGFGDPRIFCRNLYVSSQQVEQMSGLVPNVQTKSWSRTSSNDVTETFKCTMPVTKNSCAEDMILTSYHKLVLYFLSMGAVSLLALVVALAIIKCEVLTCDCGICFTLCWRRKTTCTPRIRSSHCLSELLTFYLLWAKYPQPAKVYPVIRGIFLLLPRNEAVPKIITSHYPHHLQHQVAWLFSMVVFKKHCFSCRSRLLQNACVTCVIS